MWKRENKSSLTDCIFLTHHPRSRKVIIPLPIFFETLPRCNTRKKSGKYSKIVAKQTARGYNLSEKDFGETGDVGRVVHVHALRHSFSSLLARESVHPHVLQALARHSRVETTMGFYTHILRGDDVSDVESLRKPKDNKDKPKKAAG